MNYHRRNSDNSLVQTGTVSTARSSKSEYSDEYSSEIHNTSDFYEPNYFIYKESMYEPNTFVFVKQVKNTNKCNLKSNIAQKGDEKTESKYVRHESYGSHLNTSKSSYDNNKYYPKSSYDCYKNFSGKDFYYNRDQNYYNNKNAYKTLSYNKEYDSNNANYYKEYNSNNANYNKEYNSNSNNAQIKIDGRNKFQNDNIYSKNINEDIYSNTDLILKMQLITQLNYQQNLNNLYQNYY
eukprot:Mrub_08979.p1 GENE.Mrub_08979~~Mrub_08979.p1  ORF type:complete len:237 (+),score=23.02 Mrub_08979:40-750(+)